MRKLMQTDFEEIKETNIQLPSSRREIAEDMLEQICLRQVRDCWGCTSCIKECSRDAIRFFLGADVGGRGASMIVSEKPDISTWTVEKPDGTKITIQVNKKDANKY